MNWERLGRGIYRLFLDVTAWRIQILDVQE
uniref:Uncharacterized protein n=1 Tax=Arundo donax TaxID=35708 RepID=A0A0A9EIB2_ARUDO